MNSGTQMERVTESYTETVALTEVQATGALAPTNKHLGLVLADMHDEYVTSRSVLGYEQGARFLEIIATPGPALTDPPVEIED
jgi:hypothetical protein